MGAAAQHRDSRYNCLLVHSRCQVFHSTKSSWSYLAMISGSSKRPGTRGIVGLAAPSDRCTGQGLQRIVASAGDSSPPLHTSVHAFGPPQMVDREEAQRKTQVWGHRARVHNKAWGSTWHWGHNGPQCEHCGQVSTLRGMPATATGMRHWGMPATATGMRHWGMPACALNHHHVSEFV